MEKQVAWPDALGGDGVAIRGPRFADKAFAWLPPGPKVIADWTSNLALLVGAHVPLLEALRLSRATVSGTRFERQVDVLIHGIERGRSFADVLEMHPKAFDRSFVQLVRIGEEGGNLAVVLGQLAHRLNIRGRLYRKVQMSLAYPALIVVVALAAVVFLLAFVVPTFARMYADFGATLPAATQVLIRISDGIRGNVVLILVGITIGVSGLRFVLQREGIRLLLDRFVLRVPVLGTLLMASRSSRFCRTLGMLVGQGVPLETALQSVVGATGSAAVDSETMRLSGQLVKGREIASRRSSALPATVYNMLAVGEETAQLDRALLQTAEHYEAELDLLSDTLTSLIEPVVIVVLGFVLGSILVAMYLPIFELSSVVR